MAVETGRQATVRTNILIVSDTHAAPRAPKHGDDGAGKSAVPEAHLLIHCGDLTMMGGMQEYHDTLDMLKTMTAPVKLVIAGNHDLSLDREYMLRHGEGAGGVSRQVGQARRLWTDGQGRARREGVTFLDEGLHRIRLPNGAQVTVYASPYTPEFGGGGFAYAHGEDRFNTRATGVSDAKKVASHPVPSYRSSRGSPVDITITHGPPYQRLDETDGGDHVGCPHLLRAIMRARPLLSVFGHIHEGWGAERVAWSSKADGICDETCTMDEWKNGAWQAGVAGNGRHIEPVIPDRADAKEHRAVLLDASSGSPRPLKRGEETLMVNAAIMDVHYKPVNAAWLVTVDLPSGT